MTERSNTEPKPERSTAILIVDTFPLLHSWRVRDVAINPDPNSGIFWVVMDSTGSTSGPTGGFSGGNTPTKDGGKALKLTYKTMLTLPLTYNPRSGPPVVKDLGADISESCRQHNKCTRKKELRKPLLVQICGCVWPDAERSHQLP